MSGYPYYLLTVHGGRLQTPPEYRGTPVAKSFVSGRIGGKRLIAEQRFEDTKEGRRQLIEAYRNANPHHDKDVVVVWGRNRPRQRLGTAMLFQSGFIDLGPWRAME